MERWANKVAIVTGASSGIGACIVKNLAQAGLKVIGTARRVDAIETLAASLNGTIKGKVYAFKCDVRNESEILEVFQWVEKELGGVDIMINNAGFLVSNNITDGTTEEYRNIMDVNVLAVAICTREATKSMSKRNVPGHIINISSIAGHYAESITIPFNLYCASKYAVTGMAHSLRNEFQSAGLNIRVTNISPGAVDTDMIDKFLTSKDLDKKKVFSVILKSQDIADAVIYSLSAPQRVQINEIIMKPHTSN